MEDPEHHESQAIKAVVENVVCIQNPQHNLPVFAAAG